MIEREGLIKNISQNDLTKLSNEMIESISICHKFIREKYDKSSVSLREKDLEYFLNILSNILMVLLIEE